MIRASPEIQPIGDLRAKSSAIVSEGKEEYSHFPRYKCTGTDSCSLGLDLYLPLH